MDHNDRTLRVLFVDDEARLLDGLRRAMNGFRARWSMAFALGGGEALSHLSTEPADIIISDMRMPGVDGALLLAEVARAHPQTIRIILSGHTDPNSARRAMRVAHQFLAKPIAAPALAEAIIRLGVARDSLDDGALRQRASAAGVLPAAADLYEDVTRLCADPRASILQFAEVIERDPAMTAKLLQLAASAFFGSSFRATGLTDVVAYVGLDTLRTIVRAGELATPGSEEPVLTPDIATHQRHSLLVARIARRIVSDRGLADDAFAAGLLHDIGKLFMLDRSGDSPAIHAAVSAYLLSIWGLPDAIVAAVAGHHAPGVVPGGSPLAAVVHVADVLAEDCMEHRGWTSPSTLDVSALETIGMTDSMAVARSIAVEECAVLGTDHHRAGEAIA